MGESGLAKNAMQGDISTKRRLDIVSGLQLMLAAPPRLLPMQKVHAAD
jgi:hypothetical protein